MPAMTDTITVLRAHGRRLAKAVNADGSIEDYDLVRTVDLAEVQVEGLAGLGALLQRLAAHRDCCVVRGRIADASRVKGVRRLLHRDTESGDEPTLREEPRRWAALDFDSLARPDWIEHGDLLACGCVAIEVLPDAFRSAGFVVQATAGHGLKPGIRIRLWCWLSRTTSGSELKYWLRSSPVDRSIFAAAQVIYTAAPIFLEGAFDPLPIRLDFIPGAAEVIVPDPRRLRPRPPRRRDQRDDRETDAEIAHLAHFVEGTRALYWAARRVAEKNGGTGHAAALLEAAAVRAGLTAGEAAATIKSGLRHV
jgi:hypothetical protein